MKTYLLLLSFIIICTYISAQDTLYVKKGRINTTIGSIIVVQKLKLQGNEFVYFKSGRTEKFFINKDDVLKIDKKVGSHALLYGVIMGASGFFGAYIGSTMAENSLKNRGMSVDKNVQTTTILALGGVSTLIGIIWGANVPKYKTVYTNSKYAFINPEKLNFTVSFGKMNQVGVRYNF